MTRNTHISHGYKYGGRGVYWNHLITLSICPSVVLSMCAFFFYSTSEVVDTQSSFPGKLRNKVQCLAFVDRVRIEPGTPVVRTSKECQDENPLTHFAFQVVHLSPTLCDCLVWLQGEQCSVARGGTVEAEACQAAADCQQGE